MKAKNDRKHVITEDDRFRFYNKIKQNIAIQKCKLSPFLSHAGFLLKKFDKSTDINYNTYVAKTGFIWR